MNSFTEVIIATGLALLMVYTTIKALPIILSLMFIITIISLSKVIYEIIQILMSKDIGLDDLKEIIKEVFDD